jgi:uncharacterized membrane protein
MVKTSMGLEENIAGVLCYVLGWITGWIPFISWAISTLIWILVLILWLILMFKAYQGEMYKLPIVGNFAEKQIG